MQMDLVYLLLLLFYSIRFQDLLNRSTEPHIAAARGNTTGGYSG